MNAELAGRWVLKTPAIVALIAALAIACGYPDSARAGAMQMDGKFQVSATGGATYDLPITIPPGTAGMQPSLSLDYNSGAGNGLLGVGWSLSGLLAIDRCPQTIAQDATTGRIAYDSNDRFCLGGQRLIVISGTFGADSSQYRTELDGFSLVIAHGSAGTGPVWFEVHTKSGQTMEFGNTTDSRVLALGKTTARLWALDKVTDTKGNYFTVTYTNSTTTGEYYPTRIDYTGNAAAGVSPYASVRFAYQARPSTDVVPMYAGGSMVELTQQLTDIQTYVGANAVLDYALTYQTSPINLRSRLTSIGLCIGSGRSNCPQSTNLTWSGTSGTPSYGSFSNWLNGTMGGPVFGDINGDGKPDLLIANRGSALQLALGTGSGFSTLTNTQITDGGSNFEGAPTFADLYGHGRTDLLLLDTSNHLRLYPSTGTGISTTPTTLYTLPASSGSAGAHDLPPVSFRLMDLNGDARPDLVYWSDTTFFYGLWNGTSFGTPQSISLPSNMNVTGVNCSTNAHTGNDSCNIATMSKFQVYAANLMGRGTTDLVLIYQSEVTNTVTSYENGGNKPGPYEFYYIPWNGNGYGTPVKVYEGGIRASGGNKKDTIYTAEALGITLADVNGDGLTDIYLDTGAGWTQNQLLYIANGNGLNSPQQVPVNYTSGFGGQCPNGIQFADLFGTGRTDLICQTGTSSVSYAHATGTGLGSLNNLASLPSAGGAVLADLDGDGHSDLISIDINNHYNVALSTMPVGSDRLTGITTALGVTTSVVYSSIDSNSAVYTKGSTATYPVYDVNFPMPVVSEVDVPNGVGGTYRTTYKYNGLQVDAQGRGILGFLQRTETDQQTGIFDVTNYRLDFPFIGDVASETTKLGLITPVTQVTNSYASISLGGTRAFPYLSQKVTQATDWDSPDSFSLPTVTTTYQYDSFGNATQVVVSTPDGATKTTASTYTNDTVHWFLGRLTQAQVTSVPAGGGTGQTRTSSFAYDTATGLLAQEVIEPTDPTLRQETDYTYDAFGNKASATVSGANIATRTSSTAYDGQGRFPLTATNALGQSASQTFEPNFGGPATATDANGLVGQTQYDSLGRKTLLIAPNGTRVKWEFLYCGGFNGGTATCPAGPAYFVRQTPLASDGVTQIAAIATAYFDQMERQIEADGQSLDGSVTRQTTAYDSFGHVATVSRPFFATGGTPHIGSFIYDSLGRVLTETAADGGVTRHVYHGLTQIDTNVLGQTQTTVKNSQGKVVQVIDPLGNTTNFAYDAFENLLNSTDSLGHVISATYDLRGRKITATDPDLGQWSYGYDSLGQLISQTDAKGQVSNLAYDVLGRLVSRTEPDLTSSWTYDTRPHGIAKLSSSGTSAGFQRSFTYDSLSRPVQTTVGIDGLLATTTTGYDANGRIASVTYPSGFALAYRYSLTGALQQITDPIGATTYWTASSGDAEGHLLQEQLGNGLANNYTYDSNSGRLIMVTAGASNAIENATFQYDLLGNLTERDDLNVGLSDVLTYDSMNRLTQVVTTDTSANIGLTKTVAYDAMGNITSRSDIGSYYYDPLHIHAVNAVIGAFNATYGYDANGNMTSGAGRTVTWTSFNLALAVTQGGNSLTYTYDCDHARIKQASSDGSAKYYLNDPTSGAMADETIDSSGGTSWNDYIIAGGNMIGLHAVPATGPSTIEYFHKDHLGSIAVVTDANANVLERGSYDAWGKRRFITGLDAQPTTFLTSIVSRGFTGQEQMDAVGLINFNGRIYDALIGRFLSADPFIQAPMNSQSYNRYSYIFNNPLSGTDPSGYFSLGDFFGSIFNAIAHLFESIIHFIEQNWRTILSIAVAAILQPYLAPLIGPFAAAVVSGAAAGGISSGSLQGVVLGAISAAAFFGVGEVTLGTAMADGTVQLNAISSALAKGSLTIPTNILGHAAVGCLVNEAGGGQCGPGALSGALGAAADFVGAKIHGQNSSVDYAEHVTFSAVAGGFGSVAGGGKFENGAITGAFGYIFNAGFHTILRAGIERHQSAVDQEIDDLLASGYTIEGENVLAKIQGLPNRFYDIVAIDPYGNRVAIEVKTTIGDYFRLNDQQMTFDIDAAGGLAATVAGRIDIVSYVGVSFEGSIVAYFSRLALAEKAREEGVRFQSKQQ